MSELTRKQNTPGRLFLNFGYNAYLYTKKTIIATATATIFLFFSYIFSVFLIKRLRSQTEQFSSQKTKELEK